MKRSHRQRLRLQDWLVDYDMSRTVYRLYPGFWLLPRHIATRALPGTITTR